MTEERTSYEAFEEGGIAYFASKIKNWVNSGFATKDTATQSANGLMSASDKKKLDGVAAGATANVGTITGITTSSPLSGSGTSGSVALSHANSGVTAASKGDTTAQTPGFGGTFKVPSGTVNATGHLTAFADHTVTIPSATATSSAAGLMSAEDKAKLNNIAEGATDNVGTITGITTTSPISGSGTSGVVALSHATSGPSTTSNTSKGDTTAQTPAFGGTFKVTSETVDKFGHTTALAEHTVTIPSAVATQSANGLMAFSDKAKLDGVASGAEVNQNAFSNVVVGDMTISADSKTDTFTLAAGSNVTLTPDSDGDSVTIAAKDTTYTSKSAAAGGTDVSLVTTGEKYNWNSKTSNTGTVTAIAAGVGLSSGGPITTTGTIKANLKSDTAHTADSAGLTNVANRQYAVGVDKSGHLSVNVPWEDTTYSYATTDADGLMSASDKARLDGIADNANAYVHPSYTARTGKPTENQTPAFGGTFTISQIKSDATGHVTAATDRTVTIPNATATTGAAGLMSAEDKVKLNGVASGANAYTHPAYDAANAALVKVGRDATGHVVLGSAVAKSDITALGIPGSDTTYSAMSQDEAATGTATTGRLMTAKVLNDTIAGKGYTTNTGTVTSVATGVGLTGGTITGSGTLKAKLKSETASTLDSNAMGSTANRQYAVGVDKSGYLSVNIPWSNTTYSVATTSANGLMSSSDKGKLDGVATGAEVNQNAFSNVLVGETTIAADGKTDTLTIAAGSNITLTPDATNDKVTIAAKDTTYSAATTSADGLMSSSDKAKLNGVATGAEVNQNAFSNIKVGDTTVAADGKTDTLELVAGSNVTLTPDATNDKVTITAKDTTYSTATTSANGLMSSSDKSKLDGIASGANAYTHPSYSEVAVGFRKIGRDATGHVVTGDVIAKSDITALGIPGSDTTYSAMSQSEATTGTATTGRVITAKVLNDTIVGKGYTGNTGTVTSVATGVGLTGGSITSSGTVKAKLRSETALTNDSAAATETSGRVYPVAVDKSGYLAVNVPWVDTNTHTITGVKGNAESSYRTGNVNITAANIGLGNVNNTSDVNKPISTATQTALNGKVSTSLLGAANGVATLDANGTVPESQLPSYVDDVLEYSAQSAFPTTGESGKIYVALDTNKTYRWSGSTYVEISASIALGTTSSTAYRGDYGNTAYTHATDSSRLTTAKSSGLYKIATTAQGHIASVTAVTKADITGLGIPGSDTNTWNALVGATSSAAGAAGYAPAPPSDGYNTKYLRADGTWAVPPDNNTVYTHPTTSGNKHIPSGGSSGQFLKWSADGTATWAADNNTTYSAGTGLSLSGTTFSLSTPVSVANGGTGKTSGTDAANYFMNALSTGDSTPQGADYYISQYAGGGTTTTTYHRRPVSKLAEYVRSTIAAATQSAAGFMSAADKAKLDGIASGANAYTHPTSSGNKHIPSGGSSGQILRWSADGTAVWGADNNTTYSAGTGLSLSSTTFSLAASGATAGSYGPSANASPAHSGTFSVPYLTVDTYGRVTSISTKTITLPASGNTDTKNTAGSTDTSSKIFLIGATSQAANPQTYSDNEIYATNGVLTTKSVQVGGTAATMQYNSTNKCIDFIFA